jgi:4-hydroxy-tetrahydrodipicolinate reductase
MGREVSLALDDSPFRLLGIVSPSRPAWAAGLPWYDNLADLPESAAVLLDFSLPGGLTSAAQWCADHSVPLVSGTTGVGAEQEAALKAVAAAAPVLHAANFSPGLNAALELVARAAEILGDSANIQITDLHHAHKKDAPSGTALALRAALGDEDIDIESVREGEAAGEHTVCFSMSGEELSITHTARQRSIFAVGALRAATWLVRQPPGVYTASDWIGA